MKNSIPAVKRRVRLLLDELFLGVIETDEHTNGIWILAPEDLCARMSETIKSLLLIAAPDPHYDVVLYDRGVFYVRPHRDG